ncbi:MAG: hypothetical protein HY275_02730 [Gemmatimonadetes bacterium]|nr:hypothetical protein [Gemmatimonadota bacterium]
MSETSSASVTIAERFHGPPRSGNGGYVCGVIARPLAGDATARLRMPPPLDQPLTLEWTAESSRLRQDEQVIGDARAGAAPIDVPPCPTPEDAAAASRRFVGFTRHAFPGCFVCGPDRAEGDGLRIFPGKLGDGGVIAAPWTPAASLGDDAGQVRREFLWAALDCPGGFAAFPDTGDLTLVLGELGATFVGPLPVGEPCTVLGWRLGVEGRKHHVGSAVYTARGRLVAKARATWFEVPASTWR